MKNKEIVKEIIKMAKQLTAGNEKLVCFLIDDTHAFVGGGVFEKEYFESWGKDSLREAEMLEKEVTAAINRISNKKFKIDTKIEPTIKIKNGLLVCYTGEVITFEEEYELEIMMDIKKAGFKYENQRNEF